MSRGRGRVRPRNDENQPVAGRNATPCAVPNPPRRNRFLQAVTSVASTLTGFSSLDVRPPMSRSVATIAPLFCGLLLGCGSGTGRTTRTKSPTTRPDVRRDLLCAVLFLRVGETSAKCPGRDLTQLPMPIRISRSVPNLLCWLSTTEHFNSSFPFRFS